MLKRLVRSREKLFGDGRSVPLDRNGKVRLMVLARALMRRTEKGRAYGTVTAKGLAVLEALLWSFHNAKSGRCFPGYARIAQAAGCAVSTVGEAIRMLERAGLLSWVNRLVRIKVYDPNSGWRKRVIRTSNAYSFADPGTANRNVPPEVTLRICSKTEMPRRTTNQDFFHADAPRQRDIPKNDARLDVALSRLQNAMQRGRTIMP